MDPAFVRHLMYPAPSDLSPVGGGHLDSALKSYVKANPDLLLVPIAPDKPFGSVTYRCYGILRWKGELPVPAPGTANYPKIFEATDPRYPGLRADPALWEGVDKTSWNLRYPKTTFDDLPGFLAEVENAYRAATPAGGLPYYRDDKLTQAADTGRPPITFHGASPQSLATHRLETAYVDKSWWSR
jgi:hypothetical protein